MESDEHIPSQSNTNKEELTRLFLENNYPELNMEEEEQEQEEEARFNDRLLTKPRETTGCNSGAGETIMAVGEGGPNPDGADRLVRLNVGGRVFTTRRSTLQRSDTRLADDSFLSNKYDSVREEYFLDRDPEMFGCVMNFLRSGHLHLPQGLCGPRVQEELTYWGLSPESIEPCCWQTYNSWTSVTESLKRLQKDSKMGILPGMSAGGASSSTRDGRRRGGKKGKEQQEPSACSVRRRHVWETLTDPRYSLLAKVYGWVALIFVTLAIFSFCAATHMTFRVPIISPNNNDNNVSTTSSHATNNNNNNNVTSASSLTTNTTTNTTLPPPLERKPKSKSIEEQLSESEVHPALSYLDLACLAFFTVEFLAKLICASRPLRYLRSINGVVDVLALLPDYIEIVVVAVDPNDLQGESRFLMFLPFLRLMRVCRVFRLVRHVPGLWVMIYTLQASFRELFLLLVFLLVGTLIFSSAIFFVDDREMFPSIPHGFWWAIVTMTTVGYGDMYPVTPLGYVLGSLTAISGVLLIGFTVPSLVNNFGLYYNHVQYALQKDSLRKQLEKERMEKKKKEEEREGKEKERGGRGWVEEGQSGHESIPLREVRNANY